jgi:hypothetical protein
MKTITTRQIVNVVVTVAVIIVNILANALPLNGLDTGEISDRFDIYFVPAGYVFSIWGLIYLGLIAFTIFQALPAQRDSAFLDHIGYLYAFSGAANIVWLFLWHYEVFTLTLLAMLAILGSLTAIYVRLKVGREKVSAQERWLVHVPFSVYLGWISVATVANTTQLLYYLNWGGWGIAPEVWAAVMLVVAAAIALTGNLARGDVAYNLVFVWAYVGIAVKHADTPTVSWTAWILAAVIAVMLIVRKPVLRLLTVPARA